MDDLAEPTQAVEEGAATASADMLSLKDGDAFLVADHQGDITGGADGLFDHDTRILSRFVLLVGDKKPAPLSYGLSATTPSSPCMGPTASCRRSAGRRLRAG